MKEYIIFSLLILISPVSLKAFIPDWYNIKRIINEEYQKMDNRKNKQNDYMVQGLCRWRSFCTEPGKEYRTLLPSFGVGLAVWIFWNSKR